MVDLGRVPHRSLYQRVVADVPNRDLQPARVFCRFLQPLQVLPRARARKIIEYMYLGFAVGKKMVREVRADEAGPAEDQDRAKVAQLPLPVHLPRIGFSGT